VASLIVGVFWAMWHLPLLWTEGSTRFQEPVWPIIVDNTAKSVLFTWVFLSTRGSLLLAVLLHAATNLFRVSPGPTSPGDFTLPLLAAAGKWLLVLVLILSAGPSLVRGSRPEALYNPTGNGRAGRHRLDAAAPGRGLIRQTRQSLGFSTSPARRGKAGF
jgi:uncharacterized protein